MNWLFKEEPANYSFDDLVRDGKTSWTGVRNTVAQRNLRSVKKGDKIFFYHTGDEKAVIGICRAAGNAYPDPADKTGKLMPKSGEGRYKVIEWVMWQMGGPGPMLGQVHHFVKYNPGKAPYAEERYLKEAHRLYKALNTRLDGREFVADEYSIADIAIWSWISRFEWQTIDLNKYPNVKRWYTTIAARPAVQKGYKVPKDMGPIPMPA